MAAPEGMDLSKLLSSAAPGGLPANVVATLGQQALEKPSQTANNHQGDLNFNNGSWTIATGSGKATASGLDWKLLAVVGVVGLLIWKQSQKR